MAAPSNKEPEPVFSRPPFVIVELTCRWRLLSSMTWPLNVGAPMLKVKRELPLRSRIPPCMNAKDAGSTEVVVMPPVSVSLVPTLRVMKFSAVAPAWEPLLYAQPPRVLKTRPARVLVPTRLMVPAALAVMTLAGSMTPPSFCVKSAEDRVRPPAGR